MTLMRADERAVTRTPNTRVPIFCFGSAGGHIRELTALLERLGVGPQHAVIGSSRGNQLQELAAAGWTTVEIPLVEPRSPVALLRALWPATRVLRRLRPSVVLTTGSAVALAFAPFARISRTKFIFVESLTRVDRPSQTGRLIELIPGLTLRTQSHTWTRRRGPISRIWTRSSTALDLYRREAAPEREPLHIFVAVGIMTRRYSFDRLFERVRAIAPPGSLIRVQAGEGDTPLDGTTHLGQLSPDELRREIEGADVVVIHAGVGLTLDCLDAGKCPVVVARREAFHEHVDDHQVEFADRLRESGLAVVETIETLCWTSLVDAASSRIVKDDYRSLSSGDLLADLGLNREAVDQLDRPRDVRVAR
jgi:UDP-N-acetylglucosamine--N-acetylmuramyl-(pentapeptide) pyrophosphoryl-undecaprenol N-acetylglucosamine transferase